MRLDADESTVLFLVGIGTICFTSCKSVYHALFIPISKVKISGNSLLHSKEKEEKIPMYDCEQLGNVEECHNKQLYVWLTL